MAIAKVILNGETLMDVTSNTVDEDSLKSGYTATKNDGTEVTGSYVPPTFLTQSKTVTPTKSMQNVIADSGYDGLSKVTVNAIPSAYIVPSGTSNITTNGLYDIGSYKSVSVNVAGGDVSVEDAIITNTLSSVYINDRVDKIGHFMFASTAVSSVSFGNCSLIGIRAFYSCQQLSYVSFPSVRTISQYAFCWCSSLCFASFPEAESVDMNAFQSCARMSYAYFPKATLLSNWCFASCTNMSDAYFPLVQTISSYCFSGCFMLSAELSLSLLTYLGSAAFYNCSRLRGVDFPELTGSIAGSTFSNCKSLRYAYIPKVNAIHGAAFYNCSSLEYVKCDEVRTISTSAFYGCYALKYFNAPMASSIGSSAFNNNHALSYVYLPSITSIYDYTFYNCSALSSVYLVGSSFVTLFGSRAFISTPLLSGIGHIYVPASLYDQYISASNWSNFSSCFVSLTDGEIAALDFS